MKSLVHRCLFLVVTGLLCACKTATTSEKQDARTAPGSPPSMGSYAYDVAFMKQHSKGIVELYSEDSSSRILLSPEWQGRVITSTAMGDTGISFGWLNYSLLSGNERRKQFNPIGGEERFWLGPEGGQFGLYFSKGDSFNIANWQVPAILDTVAYNLVVANGHDAVFSARADLVNFSGTPFAIDITRKVSILKKADLSVLLGVELDDQIKAVSYSSENTITNRGAADWSKETGLLSIWLLGMFTPSPQTVVIIPFEGEKNAPDYITSNYFGTIPADRLQIKDNVLFFTCDGKFRSKIGISPAIAKPRAAAFDFSKNVLTIVLPAVQKGADYVNSKWEIQDNPYKGDVINAYNDGPLDDGSQMGPFYEIESSSPALALKTTESGTYSQVTCHLQGNYHALNDIAIQLLGVNLDDIKR